MQKQRIRQFYVYWFDPEPSIGAELRKVRPAIVVSPDEMNDMLQTVLVMPLTSTNRPWPFRTNIVVQGRRSSVACDQLKVADKARLKSFMLELAPDDSKAILQSLQQIFAERLD